MLMLSRSLGFVGLCTLLILAFHTDDTASASATYTCPTLGGSSGTTVIGTKCYAYFPTNIGWGDAKASCEKIAGRLATIRSESENSGVASILSGTEPWIGAADDNSLISGASEGEHFWVGDIQAFWTGGQGGSPVNSAYANWNLGTNEPNDTTTEDCVQMYVNGQWNDLTCSIPKPYICEVTAEQSGTTTDTPSSGGGIRPELLQELIEQARRKFSKMIPAVPTTASPQQQRVCERVMQRHGHNPRMLEKINKRLLRSMKFTCDSGF